MKKPNVIDDTKIDEIINAHIDENVSWDRSKIIIDGILYYRKSIVSEEPTTKMTAASIIKKEAEFDYSFMDAVYDILEKNNVDGIYYGHLRFGSRKRICDFKYQIDLYSAYPHILNFERLPIDGRLYDYEDKSHMNFYLYKGDKLREDCIVVDELKEYIEANNLGTCIFLFGTDRKTGSKMGKRLYDMAHKNKKTKAELKDIHYGYWQKKYLSYCSEEDCYIRDPKYNHELLMVAIVSHLITIMLKISDNLEGYNHFVVDACYFDKLPDLDEFKDFMQKELPDYFYRIIDNTIPSEEDRHGTIVYKNYVDLPDAPRSHHKKK